MALEKNEPSKKRPLPKKPQPSGASFADKFNRYGFGFAISEKFRANVAYQFIRQQDRRGRVREGPAGQPITTALNSGLYEFFAHLVGLTLTVSF